MEMECQQCGQLLKLPNEKLPVGKLFQFSCPHCKAKNSTIYHPALPATAPGAEIQTEPGQRPTTEPNQLQESTPAPPTASASASAPKLPDPVEAPDQSPSHGYTPDPEPSLLSATLGAATDNLPKALVLYDDEDTTKFLVSKLSNLGFSVTEAVNFRDAAKQLKFSEFQLLLIKEDYYGCSIQGNHLLRTVPMIAPPSRRTMLVVLISPTMATLDDLLAFSISLDAIINVSDIPNIEMLLASTIARGKKFYSIFQEILGDLGLQ